MSMRLERQTVPQMLVLDITRERTVIDFEAPEAGSEAEMAFREEQFVLEYDPASLCVFLPKCSTGITIWQAVWEHAFTEPPYDFAICESSRN